MGEGVLFHCYKCEVDMVHLDDRDGKPTYQCPKCQDIAQFQIPFQSSEISAVEAGLSEEAQRLLGYPECCIRGSEQKEKLWKKG